MLHFLTRIDHPLQLMEDRKSTVLRWCHIPHSIFESILQIKHLDEQNWMNTTCSRKHRSHQVKYGGGVSHYLLSRYYHFKSIVQLLALKTIVQTVVRACAFECFVKSTIIYDHYPNACDQMVPRLLRGISTAICCLQLPFINKLQSEW